MKTHAERFLYKIGKMLRVAGFFSLRRCRCVTALWLLAVVSLSRPGSASILPDPPAVDPDVTAATQIIPGSVLAIKVTDEDELDSEYTVSDRGTVHFKIPGVKETDAEEWDVPVATKTTEQAKAAVADSLKKYLKAPEVSLTIVRIPKLHLDITGEAKQTGAVTIRWGGHLSDAIAVCGTKPTANLADVLIVRRETVEAEGRKTRKTRTLHVVFADAEHPENSDDPALEDGDRIVLAPVSLAPPKPVNELKTVSVDGAVKNEAVFPLSINMTVRDLIQVAGGLTESADHSRITLYKVNRRRFDLNADKVLEGDPDQNIPLDGGDLLIVYKRDRSQRFAIQGELKGAKDPRQATTFDFDPKAHLTVMRVIDSVGGLTKHADGHKGLILRGYLLDPVKAMTIPFDYHNIKKGKKSAVDYEIQAGDMIVIPPRGPSVWQKLLPLVIRFLPFGI